MRRGFPPFRRPLLDVTRAQTEQACRAQGLGFWSDPHNDDPRFTRSRVRRRVLPVLEEELGPGVAATLARTADQLREDAATLDAIAGAAFAAVRRPDGYDTDELGALLDAVRSRVVRLAALEAGCPASELFRPHVLALVGLTDGPPGPHAGRQVQLPGQVTARREGNLLKFGPTAVSG
jgi:tRNA(Ile)-lysidine synthase